MLPPTCPRCGDPVRAPGLMTSDWTCGRHGPVQPLRTWAGVSSEVVLQAAHSAVAPLWCPIPVLPGWTVTGLALAGDERAGARATVLALSGPCPLGGPADLLLVAEEPGTGLGARLAGTDALDPGIVPDGPPDAKVEVAGHPTPLWRCESAADRMAFAGEAGGIWLWAVVWPPAAELVLLEDLRLQDLSLEDHAAVVLPTGAPSTRLG